METEILAFQGNTK